MNLIEKIEVLLKVHDNTQYNELWSVCKKIVRDVIQHNKLITAQLSNYDLHDETHSEQVIYIIEKLLGEKINTLTCYEAILLYLSAYIHDSAMALPHWEYELLKVIEGTDEIYDNTLSFRINNDFKGEHAYSEALNIITDNKDKLFDYEKAKDYVFAKESEKEFIESLAQLMRDYEVFRNGYNTELTANKQSVAKYMNISKLIRSEFIRSTHHIRVVDNIKSLKKRIESVLGGFATNNFIEDLSEICRCHGESISSVFKLPTDREDFIGHKSNIQFVAMLLRLGDVIHFSSDRAPLSLYAEKKITDETSYKHWNAKFQDLNFKFDEINGIVTVKFTAFCSNPEIYYFIQDYMDWVDSELNNYFVLKQRWEQSKIDKIDNYSLAISNRVDRTQLKYDKEIFVPQSKMRFVLNQSKILELLMGVQLYKDEYLCIRELYQNSLDATKCIIAINKLKGMHENLSIEFGLGEEMVEGVNRKYLYCLDHGTGMDRYIINNFLLQIGNSYYKSKDFQRKNTNWKFGVNPTSQFGIGILSGYMLADKLGITTIHYEHNEVNSFILEGINEHSYYVKASELDLERIGKHGTIVKLYLKDKFVDLNDQYIEKLPILLSKGHTVNNGKYIDKNILSNNLCYILNKHICVEHEGIPVCVRCDDNELHSIFQYNSIMDTQNYPFITKEDLKNVWEDVHFMSGEPNPYLEVIDRLDLIANYNITICTENIELYSHISFPKKEMDKNNLYYYYLFHFVGEKEGSVLVDGVYVETTSRLEDKIKDNLGYDLSHYVIVNFTGKERPVLSVDRKSCVSMPEIDEEIEKLKTIFTEKLVELICSHVAKEKIAINDMNFSTILNIVVTKFPSLADKVFELMCETTLGNAPISECLNIENKSTIKGLMKSNDFAMRNVDFRKYDEVYRRILIGKLIDVERIGVNYDFIDVKGSNYHEFPIEKYRVHDSELSLSSVTIKADEWSGRFEEYDLVSNLWPVINPQLFDALHDQYSVKEISAHCKTLSESGNGIQGIARLNPTLINPKYGIGLEEKNHFKRKKILISNPHSIVNNFWLFELTNHNRDTWDDKKGASLFAFIAPRELSTEEIERLKEFETKEPEYVKGVKEGWSILFISNEEYIILPGVVKKDYIISQIPESVKMKEPDIIYYNTDGTRLF